MTTDNDQTDQNGDGTGDGTDGGKPDTGGTDGTDDKDDDGDGEPKWKVLARKHENENKKLREKLDKIEQGNKSDTDKAIDKAKAEAREEALAEALGDRVTDALESAATVKLADPTFVRLLDDDVRETFTDAGKVDRKAIDKALDALVKKYPHVARSGTPSALPGGGKNGGTGKGGASDMNSQIREGFGR